METRKGSPLLLVALVVVSLVLTTMYFREGDAGPLHGARTVTLAVTAPVQAVGTFVSTPLRAVGRFVTGLGVSRDEVAELRAQNVKLRKLLKDYEESRQQNVRLRKLVRFVETNKMASLGARIIGRPSNSWDGDAVIDRGTADGVRKGMPVLAAQGLVGQVVLSSAHASQVRLITDQNSGVAVMVQRTRAVGIVRGSVDGSLMLEFVDRKLLPKKGDVVITSGLGGVYPKGLVVGDVASVDAAPQLLHPKIVVRSRVSIGDLEEALVLTGAPPKTDLGGGE